MNMTFEETFAKKGGGVLMLLCRQIFSFALMMDRNLGVWGLNAFLCLKWDIQENL